MAKAPTAPPPVSGILDKVAESVTITPTRPIRRAWDFTMGTITGTLDGMARWSKQGLWLGFIGGLIVGAGTGMAAGYVIKGILVGMFSAIAIGGTLGFVSGGYKRVKYGDRQEKKANYGRSNGIFYRTADVDEIADKNFERVFQQSQELDMDRETYWTDRVSSESRGGGRWI